MTDLIEQLAQDHTLSEHDFCRLIDERTPETAEKLAKKAVDIRKQIYGNAVFTRGLIEISNICKNDCLYCGIRRSNKNCVRYRLTPEQIIGCAREGYDLGFRTIVLQGGEDPFFTDEEICGLVARIRARHPDCAVTLSIGERPRESYEAFYAAGARRYLLRHETIDPSHYGMLHPPELTIAKRRRCLEDLREIGYQVGCGMMVGSPFQTIDHLLDDLYFMQEFRPHMIGIGPFIPHADTPFGDRAPGTLEDTLHLLAVIRLMHPRVLLPATTALGTIHPTGREQGILAGANVVMPNLSPTSVRGKYMLYDGKICTGDEAAECRRCMELRMEKIGYRVAVSRGDSLVE